MIFFHGGTSTEFVGTLYDIAALYDQHDIASIERVR
jgi:hypothetical protein